MTFCLWRCFDNVDDSIITVIINMTKITMMMITFTVIVNMIQITMMMMEIFVMCPCAISKLISLQSAAGSPGIASTRFSIKFTFSI